MPRQSFPESVSRVGKSERGPTVLAATPVEIHGAGLGERLAGEIRKRTARAIGHWATLIERIAVRFETAKRGRDKVRCAIHVTLTGLPPVHVTASATAEAKAFGLALPESERAVRRTLERHGRKAGRRSAPDAPTVVLPPAPSLIGRREGRSLAARKLALVRPAKRRRDLFTDTSQPGVSETDRRAGGGHTARRNTRARSGGMTAALEDSLTTPSRKSTRRSANRGKPSATKERAASAAAVTPSARRRRSPHKR